MIEYHKIKYINRLIKNIHILKFIENNNESISLLLSNIIIFYIYLLYEIVFKKYI